MTSTSVFTKDEIHSFVADLIKALGHDQQNSPVKETTHIDNHDAEKRQRLRDRLTTKLSCAGSSPAKNYNVSERSLVTIRQQINTL